LALLVSALCLLAAGAIALRAANTRGVPAFSSVWRLRVAATIGW